MRIINTLLKTAVFSLSVSAMPLQAEPAIYDGTQYQLELPSVAVISGGEIQGYLSVKLQVLSADQGFTVLDNAYATAIFGDVQALPMTANPSATYDTNSQKLTIPALNFSNPSNASANALTLKVLATLDNTYVLGL